MIWIGLFCGLVVFSVVYFKLADNLIIDCVCLTVVVFWFGFILFVLVVYLCLLVGLVQCFMFGFLIVISMFWFVVDCFVLFMYCWYLILTYLVFLVCLTLWSLFGVCVLALLLFAINVRRICYCLICGYLFCYLCVLFYIGFYCFDFYFCYVYWLWIFRWFWLLCFAVWFWFGLLFGWGGPHVLLCF